MPLRSIIDLKEDCPMSVFVGCSRVNFLSGFVILAQKRTANILVVYRVLKNFLNDIFFISVHEKK